MHLLYMVEEDNRVIFGKVQSKEKQVNLIWENLTMFICAKGKDQVN